MREYRCKPLLLFAVFLAAVSGCGVKGPLYLPDKQAGGEPKEVAPEEEGALEDDSLY